MVNIKKEELERLKRIDKAYKVAQEEIKTLESDLLEAQSQTFKGQIKFAIKEMVAEGELDLGDTSEDRITEIATDVFNDKIEDVSVEASLSSW
jgi:hypothetical protein